MPRVRQIQGFTTSSTPKPKQISQAASEQTTVRLGKKWPRGIPPIGPREYLLDSGQHPTRRQPRAAANNQTLFADASTSILTAQRPSLSLTHHTGTDKFATTESLNPISNGAGLHAESSKGAEYCLHNVVQTTSPIGGQTGMAAPAGTTKKGMISLWEQTPRMQPESDVERSKSSAPDFGLLLNQISVPQTLPSPSSPPDMAEKHLRSSKGSASTGSNCPVNEIEASNTSSPLGIRHRDIGFVTKNSQRSSSVAASVTSMASSAAGKSSSSSVSSSLRRNICHICKKPPFREKLKGCFECARQYHKGCATPKDR